MQIKPSLEGSGLSFDYDPGPDPLNFTDGDTLSMYLVFNIINGGVWSIFDVRLDIDLIVQNCKNSTGHTLIPDDTRIGGSADREYNFLQFTSTTSENFSMSIDPAWVIRLIQCTADLKIQLSFEARYAQLTVDADLVFPMAWTNLTPSLPAFLYT
jgi:hypothetical protein